MNLPPFPPRPFPAPFFFQEEEEDTGDLDEEFIEKMNQEGFNSDLIEMGLKVANNHSRSREEALKIGENYIREMSR